MRKRLFFVEKKSQAEWLSSCLGANGDIFIVIPSIGSATFDVSLSKQFITDISLEKKVKYIRNKNCMGYSFFIFEVKNKMLNRIENQVLREYILNNNPLDKQKTINYLNSFNEWIVAVDCDQSGQRGFDLFFKIWLKESLENFTVPEISKIFADDYSLEKLRLAFLERKQINDKQVFFLKNGYKNKDFFDYNFNINSIKTFEPLFCHLGINKESILLTHFKLRTLFEIADSKSISIVDLISKQQNNQIGSPASRSLIVEDLFDMGLIQENKKHQDSIVLTEVGEQFVNILDKSINEINVLKYREDCNILSQESFNEKYSKFIKVFFEKKNKNIENAILQSIK